MNKGNFKLLLFNCCFLVLFIPTDQGRLPNPSKAWRVRPYLDQRDLAPLSVNGYEQRLSRYENTRVRKSRDNLRNYYIHRLPETEYDAEGMLFLSSPRNRQDRELNRLMNKVVDYSMVERNGLRQKPRVQFSKKELDRLKLIVRSFENENEMEPLRDRKKTPVDSDVYMNFADLVL